MFRFLKNPNFGILVARLGLGGMMMAHGVPKFMAGSGVFEKIGGAMAVYGITFWPVFWGFIAASTEVLGGLLLALGYKMRFVALALAFMMLTGVLMKMSYNESFKSIAWPAEMFIMFFSLMFIGPGKYSIDKD